MVLNLSTQSRPLRCLHCDMTKEAIAARGITICATESGYEYVEISEEWPRHRWVDWTNTELARLGVKPEAFALHRRTRSTDMQWIGCDDTVAGHHLLDEQAAREFDMKAGQCLLCGHLDLSERP